MSSSTLARPARAMLLAAALIIASDRLYADRSFHAVRILSPVLAGTLDDLYRASSAAREVVDRLEQSDLIIHVQRMDADAQRHFTGTLRFVHAAGGRRFLRVTINERLAPDRRAAALAHELQHALEVANAAEVVDAASFAALYRSIGRESAGGLAECYETEAAQRLGMRALADYRAAAAAARRGRITAANSSH